MLVPIHGEHIAPIFKGQDGNNRLLQNITQQLPTHTVYIPQKRRPQLYHSRSLEMSNTIYCTELIFTYRFFFWSSWCPYGLLQRMEELETKTIFLRWSFNDLASIQKNCPNPVVTLKDTISKRTLGTHTTSLYTCSQTPILYTYNFCVGSANFPKIYETSQNCRHQKGHKMQVYNCDQIILTTRRVKNSVLTITNKIT